MTEGRGKFILRRRICARRYPPAADAEPRSQTRKAWRRSALAVVIASCLTFDAGQASDLSTAIKLYGIADGKVDARTYNGFRRYHAGCNHCHGPDGVGSTFGPSLVDRLVDVNAFRRIVLEGRMSARSAMQGFADDPNVVPHIDDIYAYLQARADGKLGRGRPVRIAE
jgi:mono/diheme cytochrome c family protein